MPSQTPFGEVAKALSQIQASLPSKEMLDAFQRMQESVGSAQLNRIVKVMNSGIAERLTEVVKPTADLLSQLDAIQKPSRQLADALLKAPMSSSAFAELGERMAEMNKTSGELLKQFSESAVATDAFNRLAETAKLAEQAAAKFSETLAPAVRMAEELGKSLSLAKTANSLIPELGRLREDFVTIRACAVAQAHEDGMSYQDIGQALGVSKPLVQQMVQIGRRLDGIDETFADIKRRLERIEQSIGEMECCYCC